MDAQSHGIKFRKKPVIIEALQWTGDNWAELCNFARDSGGASVVGDPDSEGAVHVRTLEDGADSQVEHIASKGDWIVKGVRGEFYAVKPDIFEDTYERA